MSYLCLSAFEVELLMKLYYSPNPFSAMDWQHRRSAAVRRAIKRFVVSGWLQPGITFDTLESAAVNDTSRAEHHLSLAGQRLVNRIRSPSLENL